MNRHFKLSAIAAVMALTSTAANAEIFIRLGDIVNPDTTTGGYGGGKWFIADSFSFGVEREMKESGEKGGTQDINIGVGELQALTIGKGLDSSRPNWPNFHSPAAVWAMSRSA